MYVASVIAIALCVQLSLAISPDNISMASSLTTSVMPGIAELLRRPTKTGTGSTPMYDRITPSPMLWIHLRKAQPILIDKEFYNITTVPGMNVTNMTFVSTETAAKPIQVHVPEMQHIVPHGAASRMSLLQTQQKSKADPIMIQNGLYLSMPLRNPPQETFNVAAVEDTRGIQGTVDYRRKRKEADKLMKRFHQVLQEFMEK